MKSIKSTQRSNEIRGSIFLGILFLLSYFSGFTNSILERFSWEIFEQNRKEIVEEVSKRTLIANGKYNNGICKLPYDFPVLSHNHNEIVISQGSDSNTFTVKFFVHRNFFEAPSTYFIYSNDPEYKKRLILRTSDNPEFNWEIEKDWYRIYGDH